MLHICGRPARSISLPLNERDVSLKLTCSNFSSQVRRYSPPKIVLHEGSLSGRFSERIAKWSRAISNRMLQRGCWVGRQSCRNPLECGCSWAVGPVRRTPCPTPLIFRFFIPLPSLVSPSSLFLCRTCAISSINLFLAHSFLHLIFYVYLLLLICTYYSDTILFLLNII